jgi:tRNA(Ile)-lysidine synthase
MLNEFNKFISDNNLINQDERILLAVSGGIDSMIMAHLFQQTDFRTGIAHCNFCLRAGESDKDEELVRNFAAARNIPFYTIRFETKSFAKKNGISIQMAARELRYTWFEKIRKENLFDKISVAHNLNDNIETLIINLIRGTGITGLTGMKPATNRIIRPILFATRQDIISYCNQNKIGYREDKSNSDTKYARNKIRHKVIPVLKEINPSIENTLNETAERFSGINEIVSDYISMIRASVSEQKGEFNIFNISLLSTYLHNKTILFELFRQYSVTNVMINDLIAVVNGRTGGRLITGTHRIIKNRKELIISQENNKNKSSSEIRNIDELRKVPFIESVQSLDITPDFGIPGENWVACLDAEKIEFPLVIRKWEAGDYFYPLGMNQKKKLSDYFIDKKYSGFDKENILILESGGQIIWIIGDRIDNRFRINKSSKKALIIKTVS